jgi:deoxyribodipyrimidine photo-lyase
MIVAQEAPMVQPERIQYLNGQPVRREGDYVLYWMQASQRAEDNHALEHAAALANELGKPLVAFFGVTAHFPGANLRHYAFMLEGLDETRRSLARRGIRLVVLAGDPGETVLDAAERACLVVVDCGYLRVEKGWRAEAARTLPCHLVQVESNVVVPVEAACEKEAYSAATLRPRIHRLLERFLLPVGTVPVAKDSVALALDLPDLPDSGAVLRLVHAHIDASVGPLPAIRGGSTAALARLDEFAGLKIHRYDDDRNDPTLDGSSGLSPYLHFGQISPLRIALRVKEIESPGSAPFLEQLIVRRELAVNFVRFNERHDRYEGLPAWCRNTLGAHANDPREYIYTQAQFESAGTHDPYWNAAQTELARTGKVHGYMRMYWGKKILEWSASPSEAFRTALHLNDRYALDGRDPNGFAGVAWCFGKHDRPWAERPVFGLVRYMNAAGLRRKFDADGYVRKVALSDR